MGAVQKLATVVIIGLTALAVLLVLSLADEPNRRAAEAEEQEHVAIERGIETYITYCLTCHGPAGEGSEAGEGWIGKPIGGNTTATLTNQSTDPVTRSERETFIRLRIHGGQPIGCTQQGATCIMPSWGEDFGGELNDEQIEELVLMIQNVDWDLVYNDAIETNGGAYPEPPAPAESADAESSENSGDAAAPTASVDLAAPSISWSTNELSVPVGGTINLINDGSGGAHNFVVEGYNDDAPVDMPPGSETPWVVPADLAPGTYTYYCAIPGHRALMEGTLTVAAADAALPPAEVDAAAAEGTPAASPDASGDATPAPAVSGNATPEAATPAASPEASPAATTLEAVDFAWTETAFSVSPGQTISLVNSGLSVHNFTVVDLGANVPLPVGASTTWTVPADATPGIYRFICAEPGHEGLGMVGTLTVT